jgi:hypothetical protein
MSGNTSWQSPDTNGRYENHDYADFAQEFLRRNPDYRRDFSRTEQRVALAPELAVKEREGLARRWGLSFPLRSGKISNFGTRALVSRRARHDNHLPKTHQPDSWKATLE